MRLKRASPPGEPITYLGSCSSQIERADKHSRRNDKVCIRTRAAGPRTLALSRYPVREYLITRPHRPVSRYSRTSPHLPSAYSQNLGPPSESRVYLGAVQDLLVQTSVLCERFAARSDHRRHDMRVLPVLTQATHLGLLLSLGPSTVLGATAAVTAPQDDAHIGTTLTGIRDGDYFPQPSTQPVSPQPIVTRRPPPNATIPIYTVRLRQLHTILASPATIRFVRNTLERALQVLAYYLFDYELLYDQGLALHIGDFTLQFQDVATQLSVLAVKTVMMKLIQMLQKGLLGFFEGELIRGQAEVRMIFAFGVLGGAFGDWEMMRRRNVEDGRTGLANG